MFNRKMAGAQAGLIGLITRHLGVSNIFVTVTVVLVQELAATRVCPRPTESDFNKVPQIVAYIFKFEMP